MGNREAALRFFTGLNAGDVGQALADFADGATYLGIEKVGGELRRKEYRGKPAIHAYLSSFVDLGSAGSLHYDVVAVAADGPHVMVEWTDVARNAAGEEYVNRGVNTWEFGDAGQVLKAKSFPDWAPLKGFGYTGRA
jgi:ketosteroid isomerase-like protein